MEGASIRKKGSSKTREVIGNTGENKTWKIMKFSVVCRVNPVSMEYSSYDKMTYSNIDHATFFLNVK